MRYQPTPQNGFTLIEILVAIGLLALLAGVMAPQLLPSSNTQLKNNARLLISALRETRLYALQHNTSAALSINTQTAEYRIPGKEKTLTLAGDMKIQLTTAKQELAGIDSGNIRFYPDGSSTGGRITLSTQSLTQHIDVTWLTGRVKILTP